MKIIVGCPIKDRAWVIPQWHAAIRAQEVDVEVVCLYSASEDDTRAQLESRHVTILDDPEIGRRLPEIDGHMWGGRPEDYSYMTRIRNDLMDYVVAQDPDYFLSLDSDILLCPGALKRMVACLEIYGGIVSPAVNMSQNGRTAWNVMTWADRAHPGVAHRRVTPVAGQVDVIMAALLFDREGMQCRWSPTRNGEDIGLCIDAERLHVPRWWLPDLRCDHLMRPSRFQG
jgi:hypothetical protein